MSIKDKINIIQFMPYFPPHKGGLETVGEEIGIYWTKYNLGTFINVITSFNQSDYLKHNEKIIYDGEIIGYLKDGVINLVIPSFDIVNNFPSYKFCNERKKIIFKYLENYLDENNKDSIRILTHTRFFLTSFFGGLFARKNKVKWIHIEHGSDYVKLSSKFKSNISYIYDRLIGKWVFKNAYKVLAISNSSRNFIKTKFLEREIFNFYRGLVIPDNLKVEEDIREKFKDKIIIGYIGRLYKWKNVESLINAYESLLEKYKNKICLVIVGDGEDYEHLKNISNNNEVYFTGGKSFEEALSYQKQFDIHVHPSSPGGGLATTLLQAMRFGNMIVATPNEGALDVIIDGKNGYIVQDDSVKSIKNGIEKAIDNLNKVDEFAKINKNILNEKFTRDNNINILHDLIK